MGISTLPPAFIALCVGVFGLLIGSFLNVVIARVPHDLSIVSPPSRCPRCGYQLRWFDNIPVLSWLWLRGRCRGCQAGISPRYPMVEILTGLLFLACLGRLGPTWEAFRGMILCGLLIPLTFIDLEHWILPFEITLPGIALGVLSAIPLGIPAVVESVAGALLGFFSFWLLEWVGEKIFKKEALGGGDKFLLALLLAFLGFKVLLLIVFLASLQGSVVGLVLLWTRGRAGPAPEPSPAAGHAENQEEASNEMPEEGDEEDSGSVEKEAPRENSEQAAVSADEDEGGDEEDDWVPGPTNIPFGPWLSVAGLEVLLLKAQLLQLLPSHVARILGLL